LADGSGEDFALNLLGGFSFRYRQVQPSVALGRKASALLAILALSPDRTASRDRLASLLWSTMDDASARGNLRQALTHIRRSIGPVCDELLVVDRTHISLRQQDMDCDVQVFRRHLAAGRCPEALAVYRGPFLDGLNIRDPAFETWSEYERRTLHDRYLSLLEKAAGDATAAAAVEIGRKWVAADPLREQAHKYLIQALVETGAREEALLQARTLRQVYRDDLGLELSDDVRRLVDEIERPRHSFGGPGPAGLVKAPASPVLAVHPLVCLSPDSATPVFASSLSGGLVTTLSKLPYLRVVAMGTAGQLPRARGDLAALDRAAAADYVLEGQVQATEGRVRVNVHLVDCRVGEYVFSHRYDADLCSGFAAQDEITMKVAVAINVAMLQGDQALSKLNRSNRLEPWELVLQASTLISSHDRLCFPAAFRCISEAKRLDPDYAAAHTLLAWWHWQQAFCGWSTDPARSVAESLAAAEEGSRLDPANPEPHVVMAIANMQKRDFAAANDCLARATALGRNHAMVYAVGANVANFSNQPRLAIRLTEQAMRLCPVYPPWYAGDMAQAHLQLGQLARCLEWAKAATDRSAGYIHAHLFRVIALQEAGRLAEVGDAAQQVLALDPAFDATAWAGGQPFLDASFNRRFLDALLAAGLPGTA